MKLIPVLIALVLFSACTPALQDPSEFDGVPRCGAENFQFLLGKRASALDGVDLPSPSRVLRPGDVITLDFSPDRLTIDIDELGLITSVTCR